MLCTPLCELAMSRLHVAACSCMLLQAANSKQWQGTKHTVHPNPVVLDYTRFCIESTTKTTHTHTSECPKNQKSWLNSIFHCLPSTAVRWPGGLQENQSGKHLPPCSWTLASLRLTAAPTMRGCLLKLLSPTINIPHTHTRTGKQYRCTSTRLSWPCLSSTLEAGADGVPKGMCATCDGIPWHSTGQGGAEAVRPQGK